MANNSDKTFRDLLNSGQAQILGIVSIVPMDNWNGATTYQKLNYVRHNGATYLAKKQNINIEPGVSQDWKDCWMLGNYDGGIVIPNGTYPDMTAGKVVNALMWGSKSYDGSSPQTITAADLGISSVYTPQGSISFASLPQTPSANELGYVWNISDSFTTDSRFLEGAGIVFAAGTNVGVIENNGNYYYDVLGAFFDLSNYVTKTQVATSSSLGLIQLGYQKNEKNYPVELDSNNRAYVNVPWDGANYSAGTGLELSEQGVFSLATPVSVENGGTGQTDLSNVTVGNATSAEKVANALTVTVNGTKTAYDGSSAQSVTVAASNPNLLDNSNFAINQRGLSTYSGTGYGVDRWRSTSTASLISVRSSINSSYQENSGIKLTGNYTELIQYLPNWFKRGVKYTISVGYCADTSSGTWGDSILTSSYTFKSATSVSQMASSFSPFSGITISIATGGAKYVRIYRNSTTNLYYSIRWIKLEEGEVATPFVAPDPATELLKCQRYYVKYSEDFQIAGTVSGTANTAYVTMFLPATMRTIPTIVSWGGNNIRLNGSNYSTIDDLDVQGCENNKFYLKIHTSADYPNMAICVWFGNSLELSAELTS